MQGARAVFVGRNQPLDRRFDEGGIIGIEKCIAQVVAVCMARRTDICRIVPGCGMYPYHRQRPGHDQTGPLKK